MSIPLFLPIPDYVPKLNLKNALTLKELCEIAGVQCKASGEWTKRKIKIEYGKIPKILAEPGDWGGVLIEMVRKSKQHDARLALGIMAYAMHDLVAKQSIAGAPWAKIAPPRGRPNTGKALTSAERQRRFRNRHQN